jgi:hypothetical protein
MCRGGAWLVVGTPAIEQWIGGVGVLGLVPSPKWTPVQGWSLARRILFLIMATMVPATLAHVAVATGW